MPSPRPFRFAVQSYSASSGKEWRERAQRVEQLGYSTLFLADHFLGPGTAIQHARHPVQQLAPVPAMAVAAAATETLRVGCRVFCQDYKHPVILAKEVATLDLLSDGRIEFGLGAGWIKSEYEAIDLSFERASIRIARLEETVSLVKALMSGEQVDHQGESFRVSGFAGAPKPKQTPHPPLMIGGGSKRVLTLAAQQADIVSVNFNNRSGQIGADGVRTSTAAATREKIAWIREAAGARLEDIELEIGAYFVGVGPQGKMMATAMAGGFELSLDEMLSHPHALFGDVDEVVDLLEARRAEFGFSYITVPDMAIETFAPVVERLAGR